VLGGGDVIMEKRIRFGDLVRNSGRPEPVTLWRDPSKDRNIVRAKKENRILTVVHEPKRRDYGLIGLHQRREASTYLLFPRPLPKEKEAHVIGINWQLVES
jgi:hypothetical protein